MVNFDCKAVNLDRLMNVTVPKPVSTKITEEQRFEVERLLTDRTVSRFIYEAIREKVLAEGGNWPEYEFDTHGGKREGAGRPSKS